MSILDYSKLPLVHIIISQQLSSFIDYSLIIHWAENWIDMENTLNIVYIIN